MLGTETISITINVREQKLVKKDRKCKNVFSCVLVFKKILRLQNTFWSLFFGQFFALL